MADVCMSVFVSADVIIGAAQLCNKMTGPHFDSTDEVIANALATYCCISIVNVSGLVCIIGAVLVV